LGHPAKFAAMQLRHILSLFAFWRIVTLLDFLPFHRGLDYSPAGPAEGR